MRQFLLLWGPVLLVAAGVATLSRLPQPPSSPTLPDWVLHFLEFTGMGFVLARALAGGLNRPLGWTMAGLALSLGVGYGAVDEVHQSFVPQRHASPVDVAANSAGTATGVALVLVATRLVGATRRATPRAGRPHLDVQLVTGPDCPLCGEAREALARLGARLDLRVEEVRIDQDATLAAQYRWEIPVILVEGHRISKGRVSEARLAASLEARLKARKDA